MSERPGHFGRLPRCIVEHLPGMTGAEAKVYLAIAVHVNPNYVAWPGLDLLAKETGLTRRAVCGAAARLETCGAIKREPGGGRGHSTTYTLTETVKGRSPFTATKQGTAATGNCERPRTKQGTAAHETGNGRSPQQMNEKKMNKSSNRSAATPRAAAGVRHEADTDPDQDHEPVVDADLIDALTVAGIGEPKRSALAALPGMTVALVRREASKARERGKGVGALILNLESESAAGIAMAQRQAARDDAARLEGERRYRQAETERQAQAVASAETERIIGSLSDDELREHQQAIAAEQPNAKIRADLLAADPRKSRILRPLIVDRVRRSIRMAQEPPVAHPAGSDGPTIGPGHDAGGSNVGQSKPLDFPARHDDD